MNREIKDAVDAAMRSAHEATLEESARIGAIRYLVEQLYANIFISDPEGFESLLTAMIEKTHAASTPRGSIDAQVLQTLQDRTAAHLESFRGDVLRRIAQGHPSRAPVRHDPSI